MRRSFRAIVFGIYIAVAIANAAATPGPGRSAVPGTLRTEGQLSSAKYAEDLRQIDAAVASTDPRSLDDLLHKLDADQFSHDNSNFYELSEHVGDDLSRNPRTSEAQYLEYEKFLLSALSRPTLPPLDLICPLFRYSMRNEAFLTRETSGDDWIDLRTKKASMWLSALSGLCKRIDPSIDITKPVPFEIAPPMEPDGVSMPAGVDPADVKDPKARAEYKRDLLKMNQRLTKLNDQIQIHQTYDTLRFYAERYLVASYTEAPYDSDGLVKLFARYGIDSDFRNKVLSQIQKQGAPPPTP